MLINAAAFGHASLPVREPAALAGRCPADSDRSYGKRVRLVAPMPAAAQGTRVCIVGDNGNGNGNGNAGATATVASRTRCG